METELYEPVKWAEHVRLFYAEWLETAGLRVENRRAFDRFVSLMEERMGAFLMDQCADYSRLGLTREEEPDDSLPEEPTACLHRPRDRQ